MLKKHAISERRQQEINQKISDMRINDTVRELSTDQYAHTNTRKTIISLSQQADDNLESLILACVSFGWNYCHHGKSRLEARTEALKAIREQE